jgi:RNA polymerase sigma factor (sigma-70 family)
MHDYNDPAAWRAWMPPDERLQMEPYLNEVDQLRRLSDAEEGQVVKSAIAGDVDAQQQLTEAHLQLVVLIVRDYVDRYTSVKDLVQEGNMGLLNAVRDLHTIPPGVSFKEFAVPAIRRAMESDEWRSYRSGVDRQANFAVWILMQDGLRVPPFDRHPDGDGTLRALGIDEERWWALAIGNPALPDSLAQQIAALEDDYMPVFEALCRQPLPLFNPEVRDLLSASKVHRTMRSMEFRFVDYPWPVVHAISPRMAIVAAPVRDAIIWRDLLVEAVREMAMLAEEQ